MDVTEFYDAFNTSLAMWIKKSMSVLCRTYPQLCEKYKTGELNIAVTVNWDIHFMNAHKIEIMKNCQSIGAYNRA